MRYLLLVLLVTACLPSKEEGKCLATIRNTTWVMEVAKTEEQRERGLMFRAFMPEENGMLFVFERPREVAMWMKNTQIPLDMVFIDDTSHISGLYQNAKPYSEKTIHISGLMSRLIELNAGQIKAAGIQKGDAVTFTNCGI